MAQPPGGCHNTRILLSMLAWYMLSSVLPNLAAQNLAPNPSFEEYAMCPPWPAPGGPYVLEATPWYGVQASADYYNGCAPPAYFGVPANWTGYQEAHTGVGYAGAYFFIPYQNNYREYIQAPLLDTLEAGVCYEVGAWMNLADERCGCNRAGILLSDGPVLLPLGSTPQVDYHGFVVLDEDQWVYVFDYYQAVGNETHITIGNFYPNTDTQIDPDCTVPFPGNLTYILIDDVVVRPVPPEQVVIDLGPPVTACDSFVIDPGNPEIVYYWSTGHIGPTLTVYTSGTYSVTASYACTEETGEIEVTIIAGNTVDIGPPAIDLCEGDVYEIALDPDTGTYTWQDGSTGPDYSITEAGTYSVTLDDGCRETSDTMEVVLILLPLAFTLGNDTFVCAGESFVLSLDPTLGLFTWQDGSHSASYTITDGGDYALTISNQCGEASDDLHVDAVSPPVAEIGPDEILLCDGEVADILLDPDQGTYLWSDGTEGPEITLSDAGTYQVTVTNACGVESDEVLVLTGLVPVVELGPDVQACEGDTIVLVGSTGIGSFQWQDGSSGMNFTVTAPGTYWLGVSNLCGTDADTVLIDYAVALAPPNLGPDLNLCPGETAMFTVDGTGGHVLWSDMSTGDSLSVSTAGTYSVQVSNACFSYADTVTVTVSNEPPVVGLPADFALCAGDTVVLDAVVSGVNYLWSDGSSGQELEVTLPGTYAVTVSSACGMDADTVVVAAGEPLPTVELGPDTAICPGEMLEIVPVFSHVADWQWQDGSTQPTLITSAPAVITVTCFNACGMVRDTLQLVLLPATPVFTLGADTALCPGETVTLSTGLTGVDILWHDGTTGANSTISGPGTYYATVSTICGNTSDTITIDGLPAIPSLDLGPDQTICPGEAVVIDPQVNGPVDYLWQDGSSTPALTATQGGWIVLTITNACGMSTDSLLLTETTDGPQLDLGLDRQACLGETITIQAGISGVNYTWQDGSTGNSITVTASGMYSLTVSNACGMDSDTVMVDINGEAPMLDLGSDTLLCEGTTLTLTATADIGTTVTWQDNSTAAAYLVTSPGLYTARAVNRCGADTDSLLIDYLDRPIMFDLGPDTVLCPGQSVLLQAPVTGDAIEWQDGSTDGTFLADREGQYTLRVSNICGVEMDTMEVFVQADEPMVDLGPDPLWCPSDTIVLDATQPFPAQYRWNNGAITPILAVSQPGLYSVDVTTPCFAAGDGVVVQEEEDCFPPPPIYIPNVFTPNGDGINDVFRVEVGPEADILGMEGSIFDRWGDRIYGSTASLFTWDGKMEGTAMNPAVFVYVVTIRYRVAGMQFSRTFAGDLTLLR